MGSLGFEEMLVVIIVAIIVFGKDLPSVARKVGTWYTKVKRQVSDIKDEIQRQIPDIDEETKSESPKDAPLGSTPSAGLPGPDPGDPEYKGDTGPKAFDPSKPTGNGNGDAKPEAATGASAPTSIGGPAPSPVEATESKPPDSPPPGADAAAPPTGGATGA